MTLNTHALLPQALKAWNLLSSPGDHFVDRIDLWTQIQQKWQSGTPMVVLKGAGGVGKTTYASHVVYAHQHKGDHSFYASFNAASRTTLLEGYRNLVIGAQLREDTEDILDEVLINIVKGYLGSIPAPGGLILYDNAECYDDIIPFLPTNGRFLITTRTIFWPPSNIILVGKMTLSEARKLFRNITQQNEQEEQDVCVDNLIDKKLDCHPLAVAQSSAFMRETGTSLEEYLRLYEKRYTELWADGTLPPGDLSDQEAKTLPGHDQDEPRIPKTVATTWQINFDTLTTLKPETLRDCAIHIRSACAFLTPNNISERLLKRSWEFRASRLSLDYPKARQALIAYSLAEENFPLSLHSLRMHRLIQAMIKHQLKTKNREEMLWVLNALLDAIKSENNPFNEVLFLTQFLIEIMEFVKSEGTRGDVFFPGQNGKIDGFLLIAQLFKTLLHKDFNHLNDTNKLQLKEVFNSLFKSVRINDFEGYVFRALEINEAEDSLREMLETYDLKFSDIENELHQLLLTVIGVETTDQYKGLSSLLEVIEYLDPDSPDSKEEDETEEDIERDKDNLREVEDKESSNESDEQDGFGFSAFFGPRPEEIAIEGLKKIREPLMQLMLRARARVSQEAVSRTSEVSCQEKRQKWQPGHFGEEPSSSNTQFNAFEP